MVSPPEQQIDRVAIADERIASKKHRGEERCESFGIENGRFRGQTEKISDKSLIRILRGDRSARPRRRSACARNGLRGKGVPFIVDI